jgi:hypothetical protein
MLAKEISVKRYVVRLSGGERQQLETLVTGAPAAEGTDIVEGRRPVRVGVIAGSSRPWMPAHPWSTGCASNWLKKAFRRC